MTGKPTRAQEPGKNLDLEAAFDTEFDYVWNTLRRFGVREADLPDATQEVFIKLHELREEFDTSRPLRPFLCAIAFRIGAAQRRRAHVRRELLDAEHGEREDLTLGLEGQVAQHQTRELLITALQALKPERRVVVIMHDIDGTSMPEIAQALSIPLNTGYSRLRLGRAELAEAVKALREGGELP